MILSKSNLKPVKDEVYYRVSNQTWNKVIDQVTDPVISKTRISLYYPVSDQIFDQVFLQVFNNIKIQQPNVYDTFTPHT